LSCLVSYTPRCWADAPRTAGGRRPGVGPHSPPCIPN
jgi:hypothetical protein